MCLARFVSNLDYSYDFKRSLSVFFYLFQVILFYSYLANCCTSAEQPRMGDGDNVVVAVRVRPFNDREKGRKVSRRYDGQVFLKRIKLPTKSLHDDPFHLQTQLFATTEKHKLKKYIPSALLRSKIKTFFANPPRIPTK